MQDQHRKYNSLRDCLVLTLRNEGIFGFYKGLTPNLLRSIPASVITFYTYELIRSNSWLFINIYLFIVRDDHVIGPVGQDEISEDHNYFLKSLLLAFDIILSFCPN